MAMLSLPYASQRSHCLRIKDSKFFSLFAPTLIKYEKRAVVDCTKLDFKQKSFYGRCVDSVRRILYQHHELKALTTSDFLVVKTSEKVSSYRFMMGNGDQLRVVVKKKSGSKYGILVEVESLKLYEGKEDLLMIWGLFRDDSSSMFLPLDLQELGGNSKNNTVETPFLKGDAVGKLIAELDFEKDLAPFYVSFLLSSQLVSNASISTIKNHQQRNFIVPIGFGSGRPFPLGVSFLDNGSINFALLSRTAKSVVLCLYADNKAGKPALEIDLDPYVNRSGDIWHALLENPVNFTSYGYRVRSGNDNKEDHVLLDPCAKVIQNFGSDSSPKYLGELTKVPSFDWSGDFRPNVPMEKLIIYRLNVERFTKDKSSKLSGDIAGTFDGVSEKLNHFKNLGVNAILLEPILTFNKQKGPYYPLHFFSPENSYEPRGDPMTVAKSMKEMVKKLHPSGIEVFLEVPFTHTAENCALRDIDYPSYYHIYGGEELKSRNSLNCNYPIVQQMILENLRNWVVEFHIDGFCFVNAPSLTRGFNGEFLSRPPLVEAIAFDPLLSKVKIIADSWDPNEIETEETVFPHWKRWTEMNPKFRDDVRNFLRGRGSISSLATRLCGSGDIFLNGRGPAYSFNFITRNVGLTLVDLVSFSDSSSLKSELSWNCGEEGPTNKAPVLEKRLKQIRNFLFVLFISLGVPVLNMGDECGQSCGGSPSYYSRKPMNWDALKSGFGSQVTKFISFLSSLKSRRSDLLQKKSFFDEDNIQWFNNDQSPPKWDDPNCKFLSMILKADTQGSGDLFAAFNAGDESVNVDLPPLASDDANWVLLVDTSVAFPEFFNMDGLPLEAELRTYEIKAHSCLLLEVRSSIA